MIAEKRLTSLVLLKEKNATFARVSLKWPKTLQPPRWTWLIGASFMTPAGNKNYLNYIFLASVCTFDWFLLCVYWPGSRLQILAEKWFRCWLIALVFKGIQFHDVHLCGIYTQLDRSFILTTDGSAGTVCLQSNYVHSWYKNSFIIHTRRTVITNGLMRTPFDILD